MIDYPRGRQLSLLIYCFKYGSKSLHDVTFDFRFFDNRRIMAYEAAFSQKLTFGMVTLFVVTAVLLLHAGSQRYELSKAIPVLRMNVNQLNRVAQQFQEQLNGANGCTELVGSWSFCA